MTNLFLNSNSFQGFVSKYFELTNDIFINGVRYDKYTISLKNPIQIADLRAGNNEMIVKKMAYPLKEGYVNKIESNCTWVRDLEYKNIYYVISHDSKNSIYFNHFNVVKINENTDDKIEVLNISTAIDNRNSGQYTYDIIHQDNNYVYVIAYYCNAFGKDKGTMYLKKFNKKTLVFENIFNGSCTEINVIKILPNFDVLIGTTLSDGIYFYNYNLLNGQNNGTKSIAINNKDLKSSLFSRLNENNEFYFINPSDYNNNFADLEIYKCNTNLFSISKINIINGDMGKIQNVSNYNLRCYDFKKNNKKYLIACITLAVSKRTSLEIGDLSPIKFYLFEIQDDNNLYLLDVFNNSGSVYTNVLFSEEKELLLLGSYRSFSILKITDDLEFEEIFQDNKLCLSFGISDDNEIYFQNLDTSIQEISIGRGIKIISNFEEDIYGYKGEYIKNSLNVGVKDMEGNYTDCNVRILLEGDITFDDNKKTKEIKLSKQGLTSIPVVIKGESKLNVDVEIL